MKRKIKIPKNLGKKSEAQIEAVLRDGIKKMGGIAYKFVSPAHRSVPDRIILLPAGRLIFIEVKRASGKLTSLQAKELGRIAKLGFEVHVLYGEEQIKAFLKGLEDGTI